MQLFLNYRCKCVQQLKQTPSSHCSDSSGQGKYVGSVQTIIANSFSTIVKLRSVCKAPEGPMLSSCLCHRLFYTKGSLNDNYYCSLSLSLSPSRVTISLSLALSCHLHSSYLLQSPYNPFCKSASELWLSGLKIPAPWQCSVTCPSASYLIRLSLLSWLIFPCPITFSLSYVILTWLCQNPNMTPWSPTLSQSIWL